MGIFNLFRKKKKEGKRNLSPELEKFLDEYNKFLFPGGHTKK